MSDPYVPQAPSGTVPSANGEQGKDDEQGKTETAKTELSGVTDTAAQGAAAVADTAKEEAANVAHEATHQVKDLYQQTQQELKEQAAVQQERVASGLRSLGAELGSMASSTESPGIATDLVRQASAYVDHTASWLSDRDPGSLLSEIESYARRKPGTFIAAAALAGIVAGRLTRALASTASDRKEDKEDAGRPRATPVGSRAAAAPPPPAPGATALDETPLYAESAVSFEGDLPGQEPRR